MKYLKFLIPAVVLGLALTGIAHAQSSNPNYWKTNVPSSTITPLNASLTVPCANIQGGCGLSSSSAVTSLNNATGSITVTSTNTATVSTTVSVSGKTITVSSSIPQSIATTASSTFSGETINGNVTSTSYNASVTSTQSQIVNFDSILFVPAAGSPNASADIGTYINNWIAQQATAGNASSVVAYVPPGVYPTVNGIQDSTLNVRLVLICDNATIKLTGASSTALTLNAGAAGPGGSTTHAAGWGSVGCNLLGPGASFASSTGLIFGGSNGSEGASFLFGQIYGFGTDLTYANGSWKTTVDSADITQAKTLWLFPSGLSFTGEGIHADNTNFHDNTATSGSSTYVNCVVNNGGVYISMQGDQFDDCQVVNTGSGTWTLTAPHFENPGGDTNSASYIPVVNKNGNAAASVMTIVGGEDVQDASNSVPTYFAQNSSTLNISQFQVFRNSTGTMTSFIQETSAYAGQLCNITAFNAPYSSFANGFENEAVSNGTLTGCVGGVSGNWLAGWVNLASNQLTAVNGGAAQMTVGTAGVTVGAVTTSVASLLITSSTSATATTSVAVGPTSGTNKGKFCLWNGTQYTVLTFAAGSITPTYATSTTCTAN